LARQNQLRFIDRYCSRLNINTELTKLSTFVAKKVDEQSIINDNTPAFNCIWYRISHCAKLQSEYLVKQISKMVSGVSEVTINKCYKKLENMKDKLIPLRILEKYA